MIHIDGSQRSGSGTIVRYAMALAALLGDELHLTNIRARRPRPGLRAQHLRAIEALAELCGGRLEGAQLGSSEITFAPGGVIRGGSFQWDIGTAGSTTMLALTVLPAACFAATETTLRISGGLFQDFAPSAHHMQHVLFPTLARMGIEAELRIVRPGYVPRGEGIIEVRVKPVAGKIRPLLLLEQGKVEEMGGIALSSHLEQRRVSHRMAQRCQAVLKAGGYEARIEAIYDVASRQEGAALAIYARTDSGCIIGSDRAGAPRRSSEEIGSYVARSLIDDLSTGATVDRYLADQLIIYAALGDGVSQYRIPTMTEHVDTNLWLVQSMLGAGVEVRGNLLMIRGVGYSATAPGQRKAE